MSSLDLALQRALSVRLNLQISLSQLPIDRGVDGHPPRSLARAQPDAAGHARRRGRQLPRDARQRPAPRVVGRVGRSARLRAAAWRTTSSSATSPRATRSCSIRSASTLEPKLVGSWIGVWGGKVTTGWHFWDPQPWPKVEAMFGTHEAKYQLKKWVERAPASTRIERFTQSIGDASYSEIELAMPGDTVDEQVATLSQAFDALHRVRRSTPPMRRPAARAATAPQFALAVRIRGGKIVARRRARARASRSRDIERCARDAKVGFDAEAGQARRCARRGHRARRVRPRRRARGRRRLPRARRGRRADAGAAVDRASELVPRADYLLASDDALIAQCEVDRYRASGPGGQHRNKTESAVRLRHKLDRRLRDRRGQSLAGREQAPRGAPAARGDRARGARARAARRLRAVAAARGAGRGRHRAARRQDAADRRVLGRDRRAARSARRGRPRDRGPPRSASGITTGALSKLLLHDDHVARVVNDLRRAQGHAPAALS